MPFRTIERCEGYGEITLPDGKGYSGEFKNNKKHGIGYYRKNGKERKGKWVNNELVKWIDED